MNFDQSNSNTSDIPDEYNQIQDINKKENTNESLSLVRVRSNSDSSQNQINQGTQNIYNRFQQIDLLNPSNGIPQINLLNLPQQSSFQIPSDPQKNKKQNKNHLVRNDIFNGLQNFLNNQNNEDNNSQNQQRINDFNSQNDNSHNNQQNNLPQFNYFQNTNRIRSHSGVQENPLPYQNTNFNHVNNNNSDNKKYKNQRTNNNSNNNNHYQNNNNRAQYQQSTQMTQNNSGSQFNNNNFQRNQNYQSYYRKDYQKQTHQQHGNKSNWKKESDILEGKFFMDETGFGFIHRLINDQYIKDRIFIQGQNYGRAIHGAKINFYYLNIEADNNQSNIEENKEANDSDSNNEDIEESKSNNNNNQTSQYRQNQTFKNRRAQIDSVLSYPQNLSCLIGFFGYSTKHYRPYIDFDIQNKNFYYSKEKEFYFYPLETRYPKMLLRLDGASEKYPNGELFKKYFSVKFLEQWCEKKEMHLVEIIEMKGDLYEEQSDCQAVLDTLNTESTINKEEEGESIQRANSDYQKLLKQPAGYKKYLDMNVFTVDQERTGAFDDALSIEKISSKILEQEIKEISIKKAKQLAKGIDGQKSEDSAHSSGCSSESEEIDEDDTKSPNVNNEQIKEKEQIEESKESSQQQDSMEELGEERQIFRIGIHISDFSECIKKGSPLYKALECRGQSIYVQLEHTSIVKHMLHNTLIQQFSLKKDMKRLAQSLFICVEMRTPDEFEFIWESMRIKKTVIQVKENYFYSEFDKFDESSEQNPSSSQKKLVISQTEYTTLQKLGQFLFQERDKKGQTVFQEENNNEDRTISSKMVEEYMIFYNQLISREMAVKEHILKGRKEVERKIEEQKETVEKEITDTKKNLSLMKEKRTEEIQQKAESEQQLENINEAIENLKNSFLDPETELQKKKTSLDAAKAALQELKLEYETVQQKDESEFETTNVPKKTKRQKKKNTKQQKANQKALEKKKKEDKKNKKKKKNSEQISVNESDSEDHSDSEEENEENEVRTSSNKNIFTKQKKKLEKKLKSQQEKLEKKELEENNNLNKSGKDYHKDAKKSLLNVIETFKKHCILAGFNDLKYNSLEAFATSINSIKESRKLNKIYKKFLIYSKNKVVKDLDRYFSLCELEKKQEKIFENKRKQAKEEITQLKKEIEKTKKAIKRVEEKESKLLEQNLKKINHPQVVDVYSFSEDSEEDSESEDEDFANEEAKIEDNEENSEAEQMAKLMKQKAAQASANKQKVLKQLKSKIDLKEKLVKGLEQFILNFDSRLEKLKANQIKYEEMQQELLKMIEESEDIIKALKEEMQQAEEEITALKASIVEFQKSQNEQLIQEGKEAHKYLDIIPESKLYLSLTSPIRKFNDLIAQQFLNKHLRNKFSSSSFEKSYKEIIDSKANITTMRNQIKKLLGKIEKIKACRKMLLNKESKSEQVLLIKLIKLSYCDKYNFFLPDEMQETQYELKKKNKNKSIEIKDFSILDAYVQSRKQLPYDYIITEADQITQENKDKDIYWNQNFN